MELLAPLLKNKDNLVLWIGAGVSMNAGCYSWGNIERQLLEELPEVRQEEIAGEHDLPTRLAYYRTMYKEKGRQTHFYDVLCNVVSFREAEYKASYKPILDAIMSLPGEPPPILTTNIDTCLSRNPSFKDENTYEKVESFDFSKLKPKTIFHLHGRIINSDGVSDMLRQVWIDKNYIERYRDSKFRDFLTTVIKQKNILFLGSSLEEAIKKLFRDCSGDDDKRDVAPRHFALLPTNEKKPESIKFYRKMCGIQIVEYGEVKEFAPKFIKWVKGNFNKDIGLSDSARSAAYATR